MTPDELREAVAQVAWFHTIDLGNGIITPGWDRTPSKVHRIRLPETLVGKTVLDVGAWDGFFSFEAERRGASRVLATDHFCWTGRRTSSGTPPGTRLPWDEEGKGTQDGFNLARRALNSKVQDLTIDVLDLSQDQVGIFDVVLFLGVLYHMRHPLLALERVASVTGELLIVETEVDLLWLSRPAIAFYPGVEMRGDPSNWCAPNVAALKGMLGSVGFERVEIVSSYPLPLRCGRALKWKVQGKGSFLGTLSKGRVVAHARR